MKNATDSFDIVGQLPRWITAGGQGETPEDAAFFSGAALSHLCVFLSQQHVPVPLLRARLALRAAEVCATLAGRPERAGELRDAVLFMHTGDQPGPAGALYLSWARAIERPVSAAALSRALPDENMDQIAGLLKAEGRTAVTQAATVCRSVLDVDGRKHTKALLLGDAALAKALGWSHVLPILALGLTRPDLKKTDAAFLASCHLATTRGVGEVVREGLVLVRRVEQMRKVAPKLRAKGADEAVQTFLSREAVAARSLTSLRSDRAARRFCDRLLSLGAVRELTGRDTFRLYGI